MLERKPSRLACKERVPAEPAVAPPVWSTDYRLWGAWGLAGWAAYAAEVTKRDITADCMDEHRAAGDIR